jgi:hypothetical protein
MTPLSKFPPVLLFALTGWLAGGLAILLLGMIWPAIFPGILRSNHYYNDYPNLFLILLVAILTATPATLIGGVVGGRLAREGGQREQVIIAIIGGIVVALPFGCYGLWVFSGW